MLGRTPLVVGLAASLWLGCQAYDPALVEQFSAGRGGAGTGTAGGAGGSEPPPGMPTGGMMPPPVTTAGGVGGAGGVSGVGGEAGTAGASGMTGGSGTVDPGDAECGSGLRCQGNLCVSPSTSAPPICSMGGSECNAYMGSACAFDTTTMTGACLKPCGPDAMSDCPAPLMCRDLFGNYVCTDATGFAPPCTVGGTECAAFGLTCSTVLGISACWMTCAP